MQLIRFDSYRYVYKWSLETSSWLKNQSNLIYILNPVIENFKLYIIRRFTDAIVWI